MATFDLITGDAQTIATHIQEKAGHLHENRPLLAAASDPVEAEEAALVFMSDLATIREEAERAVELIAHELIDRRVPQQVIADSARVHRVTVARWKRARHEQRTKTEPQAESLPIETD